MSQTCPCRDCDYRTATCHGECEVYKGWAADRRKETVHTNKTKASLDKMYDYGGAWVPRYGRKV